MKDYKPILISLLTGVAAAFFPLVGHLHFESAFLASWIGAFLAVGYAGRRKNPESSDHLRLLQVLFWVYLSAVPLLTKDLLTGCFSVEGLGFWIFLPSPSVFLAFALTRLLRKIQITASRVWSTAVILAVAIGEFLLEFFNFPQVFFYNHIWGYWPGPIYDEYLPLGMKLIYFRGLTVGWGFLLWFMPSYYSSASARRLIWLAASGLLLGYMNLSEMGIIRPASSIRHTLNRTDTTSHFNLYTDSSNISRLSLDYQALRHEFFYGQITDTLKVERGHNDQNIESYLYAHPWQKKRMVGAKYTSYVPVWLDQDQLHIAYPQISSLHHELVHVIAKSFGNRLLNASWSIGLVEGLAVALAHNTSSVSTVDQLVAAKTPYPSPGEVREALSFTGFYGGRQAVKYTTMGSFIAYLLRNYEVERFKKSYRSADIASHYPVSMDSLVAGWHRHLHRVQTDSLDRARRSSLFSIPSLFEKRCPHTWSASEQQWDRYQYLLTERDTARAREYLLKVCRPSCASPRLWTQWARVQLSQNEVAAVTGDTVDLTFRLRNYPPAVIRLADALFMQDKYRAAEKWLNRVTPGDRTLDQLHMNRVRALRADSTRWAVTNRVLYGGGMIPPEKFERLQGPLKTYVLDKMMRQNKWRGMKSYVDRISSSELHPLDFGTYVRVVRRLLFLEKETAADKLMAVLKTGASRERHEQMLKMLRKWKAFLHRNR